MTKPTSIGPIISRFGRNMRSIRNFSDQIGAIADEHDAKASADLKRVFEKIYSKTGFEQRRESTGSEDGVSEKQQDSLLQKRGQEIVAWLQEDPNRAGLVIDDIVRWMKVMDRQPPVQGALLRRSALINLVIYFELLLTDLIQSYYLRYPAALPAEDRMLSLAELRSIGSVDEAERYLIEKEADSVLRKSLGDQLDYFVKRFKIDTKPIAFLLHDLNEITQRRNLMVHNDGIVNQMYLSKVTAGSKAASSVQLGQRLKIDVDYMSNAIDVIQASGYVLAQQCWRKWEPDQHRAADTDMSAISYDSLLDGRNTVTKCITDYAQETKFVQESDYRMIIINQAIAHSDSGDHEAKSKLLDSCDWSACSLKFTVAIAILRGENDRAFALLPKALEIGEISAKVLTEWPLFRSVKSDPRLLGLVEKHSTKHPGETGNAGDVHGGKG